MHNSAIPQFHNSTIPKGDFSTRSNAFETVYRRVNPNDWDGDGLANEIDANPIASDGDFFGPSNVLPEGANSNAYCSVSVVATGPDALVTFTGDKTSNYPDPYFVAKSGVTNDVLILIGKTYAISSDSPFDVVGASEDGEYRIKGTCQPCPTTQRFEIDSQGTVTIRKFSHSIRRTVDNKIWLDGVRVN